MDQAAAHPLKTYLLNAQYRIFAAYHSVFDAVGSIARAFELAGVMSIQIIAVCACAGIIVGVMSLTGVGTHVSAALLGIADTPQLLALFFAMCIAIVLGMGMPTTPNVSMAINFDPLSANKIDPPVSRVI